MYFSYNDVCFVYNFSVVNVVEIFCLLKANYLSLVLSKLKRNIRMLLLGEKCDVKASLFCVFIVIACSFIVFYMFINCATRINVAIYDPFSME